MLNLDNPIIVTLDRAGYPESVHRGAWALVRIDSEGGFEVVDCAGDPDQPVFARSSMKGLQGLPVVESGAADAFDFTEAELAISCASHSSEPAHLRTVATMLYKGGLREDQLRCGAATQWFQGETGQRRRLYHGCSGKHAAMLLSALHRGEDPADYLSPSSWTQQAVRSAVADMTGAELTDAIDGCSAPTFRMPLQSLALGLARLANPAGLSAERSSAADRITSAAAAHPAMIGGKRYRFDTDLIRATEGRVFAKGGAEGVIVCGVRGEGYGLCVKVDDGNERAYYQLAPRILRDHDLISSAEFEAMSEWASLERYNADHVHCGMIRL